MLFRKKRFESQKKIVKCKQIKKEKGLQLSLEKFAVFAPRNIFFVTVANLLCCQVSRGDWKTAKKVNTSPRIYLRASKCRKFPFQRVKNPKNPKLSCFNVFVLKEMFFFSADKRTPCCYWSRPGDESVLQRHSLDSI